MGKDLFPLIEDFKDSLGTWKDLLEDYTDSKAFTKTYEYTKAKYDKETCYPPPHLIFNAFKLTKLKDLKVVIVGQDPYHQKGQAMGLAFSVNKGVKVPPSLKNMYKAITLDPLIKDFKTPDHGDLTKWAEQGVLMLNDVLTVTDSKPASHKASGWADFTSYVLKKINKEKQGVIFLLWGKPAQKKNKLIDSKKHVVLETVHPSPLSAKKGFFDSGHFSKVNEILKKKGLKEINWNLD